MKREEAKQLSEIIKAYGEGKTIQLFNVQNYVYISQGGHKKTFVGHGTKKVGKHWRSLYY